MRKRKAHEYSHLYKTYKWVKVRRNHMADNPLCVMCEEDGRAVVATVCDHIDPHKGDETKFYAGPFQSLCKEHHDSTKAKQESRGVMPGHKEDGAPIDPNHPFNHQGEW